MTKSTRAGKGAAKDAAAATSTKKQSGAWDPSSFRATDLKRLQRDGVVLEGAVRIPGDEAEPVPRADERVCFVSFMQRGLSLPVHPFLRGLLFAYQAQLHDLSPNGILHIACFITLCECFLGVYPHWGLWKRLFNIKRSNKWYAIGGITISIDPEADYFDIEMPDSVQGWRKKWFYIKDQAAIGQPFSLAPFDLAARARKCRAWKHELTDEEAAEVEPLYRRVGELRRT